MQSKEFTKLPTVDSLKIRKDFGIIKDSLRKEWEQKTGQKWPTYKEHPNSRMIGKHYDAHHIIQVDHGGPNEWWNIHPAHGLEEHPKIHGKGSVANEIFKPKKD